MRYFIQLIENINYPETITSDQLSRIVQRLHSNKEDFDEGDLDNRIERFDLYVLRELPLSNLELNAFYVDDTMVADYQKLPRATSPPIVYDAMDESIIDGIHRANAAAKRGETTILAYVGLPEHENGQWMP